MQLPQKGASDGPFIAIDYGTSVTRIAYARGEKTSLQPDLSGDNPIPSVLALSPQGGVAAGPAAREREILFPRETILGLKRLLTANVERLEAFGPFFPHGISAAGQGAPGIEIGGRPRSPLELTAIYLAYLRRMVEMAHERPVRSAVLTVPVVFTPFDRQALSLAAQLAGFRRVRLIDDPTAVALGWVARGGRGRAAVCCWGAEYFSASIIQVDAEMMRVLATTGCGGVGGDACDLALAGDFLRRVQEAGDGELANEAHVARYILVAAEAAKRELTKRAKTELQIVLAGSKKPLKQAYKRSDLAGWIEPHATRIAGLCQELLGEARIEAADLDALLVAGGMTRIPTARDRLKETFGRDPLKGIDVEEAAVRGALARARYLDREEGGQLVLDALPGAIGLEGQSGQVTAILERGIAVPAGKVETFTTYLDQQTEVGVQIFGKQESEWTPLAQVEISKIAPMKAGQPVLEVAFRVDEDGIMGVEAREVMRGKPLGAELRPQRGLSSAQVRATQESVPAREDEEFAPELRRALRERASFLLRSVRDVARAHAGTMTRDEKQLVTKKIKEMEEILDAGDLAEMRSVLQEMEEVAQPLKARILNASLQPLLR